MIVHNVLQGTQPWHALRAQHFTASEAPAMMGDSPYMSRDDLLQQKATGIVDAEVDDAKLALFQSGHEAEAGYRPIAEGIIGDDLYPVTGTLEVEGLQLLASFDGLTLDRSTGFEHKLWSSKVAAQLQNVGEPLPRHYWQLEQQLLVSGAQRIMFTTSDGTDERSAWVWYESKPERRAALIAGWHRFAADLAAWKPAEPAAPVVAAPMESLPAVVVQVEGALIVGGNLPAFGEALRAFIERIPAKPATDQEFADCDAACKALKKAEEALEQAEESALAQVSDVELMRRTVADLRALARSTRLAKEKLVEAEKEARKLAIVQQAQAALIEHTLGVNRKLQAEGAGHIPAPLPGLFGPCIKGLKSLDSMRDKVAGELAAQQGKINAQRDRMLVNRAILRHENGDWIFLFADFAQVGTKDPEDFAALAALRIGNHRSAEAERLEKERERIRLEEQARADREARAKLEAEAQEAQASIAQAEQQGQIAQPVAADLNALVAERRAEAVAGIDARQAIGTAKASAQAAPIVEDLPVARSIFDDVDDDGSTLTLGQLNARLSPIKLDAAGIEALGFTVTRVKAAMQFPAFRVPALCRAIAKHALEVATAPLESSHA